MTDSTDHPLRRWRHAQTPPVMLAEMAARLNVRPATLSRWETYKRTPSTDDLLRISNLTGLDLRELAEAAPC